MTTQFIELGTINDLELLAVTGGGTRQTSQSTVDWSPTVIGGGSISIGGGAPSMPPMPEMPNMPGF